MKIKTSEATPRQLNWLVATCEGWEPRCTYIPWDNSIQVTRWIPALDGGEGGRHIKLLPSTDWAQGGPIIERERIDVYFQHDLQWCAANQTGFDCVGKSPLIATMRCYVASKLGDEAEIPEELK